MEKGKTTMEFEIIREKIIQVFDCKNEQKPIARNYCKRLIDHYLKGAEKEVMLSFVNELMIE